MPCLLFFNPKIIQRQILILQRYQYSQSDIHINIHIHIQAMLYSSPTPKCRLHHKKNKKKKSINPERLCVNNSKRKLASFSSQREKLLASSQPNCETQHLLYISVAKITISPRPYIALRSHKCYPITHNIRWRRFACVETRHRSEQIATKSVDRWYDLCK